MIAAWATVAAAATWWVEDAEEAAELSAALADVWPESGVSIVVGAVLPDADPVRLYIVDGVLVLEAPGAAPRRADATDWWTRAVLARSWLRQVVPAGPPPPPSLWEPPPAPPPAAPVAPDANMWFAAALGGGFRYPSAVPVVRVVAATGGRLGRVALGFVGDVETGDVDRYGLGLQFAVELAHNRAWAYDWSAGPVVRTTGAGRWMLSWATGLAAMARGPSAVQPMVRVDVSGDPPSAVAQPVAVVVSVGAAGGR